MSFSLSEFQREVHEWATANFDNQEAYRPLMGISEELGELADADEDTRLNGLASIIGRLMHAQLKQEQGIRGSFDKHQAAKEDAVADIIVYLAAYCSSSDIDLEAVVEETWNKVSKRNWIENPETGTDG